MLLRTRNIDENIISNHENDEINIINKNENNEKEYKISYIILEKSYDVFIFILRFSIKTVKYIISFSGIYLLWIVLHYFASHLYIKFCVPQTIFGFFISPFLTATPHCQGLRWVVYNGGNVINNMWVIIGTWICSNILIINKEISLDS